MQKYAYVLAKSALLVILKEYRSIACLYSLHCLQSSPLREKGAAGKRHLLSPPDATSLILGSSWILPDRGGQILCAGLVHGAGHTAYALLLPAGGQGQPAALAYMQEVMHKGSPCPPISPSPPELVAKLLLQQTPWRSSPYHHSRLGDVNLVCFHRAHCYQLYTLVSHVLHHPALVSHLDTKQLDTLGKDKHLWTKTLYCLHYTLRNGAGAFPTTCHHMQVLGLCWKWRGPHPRHLLFSRVLGLAQQDMGKAASSIARGFPRWLVNARSCMCVTGSPA